MRNNIYQYGGHQLFASTMFFLSCPFYLRVCLVKGNEEWEWTFFFSSILMMNNLSDYDNEIK